MSTSSMQDQTSNGAPARTAPHPYIVTEREVTNEAEEQEAEDFYEQLQLPSYILQSIIFPGSEDRDPFITATLDGIRGESRRIQIPHNGTVHPEQIYVAHPPEYTPQAQTQSTAVESAPDQRPVTPNPRRARVLENLERVSIQLNSLDRDSAQLATTIASQGVDGQGFRRPRLSFHHTPLPQLQWPGRRSREEYREEQIQRDRRERQQLRELQESTRHPISTVSLPQVQEPETHLDNDELDPPLPYLSRQPRVRLRARDRASPFRPAITTDGSLGAFPVILTSREVDIQTRHEADPPTEASTILRRRIRLTTTATPAGTQRERSSVILTSYITPPRRSINHRFRHLLSHYHTQAALPTPPSRPQRSAPHFSPLSLQRTTTPTTSRRTRTQSPSPPRPLTRSILESHAHNPRLNPQDLPWHNLAFVLSCQRLRLHALAADATTTSQRLQRRSEAALQRTIAAIEETERLTTAIVDLALCNALTDSGAVLARLGDDEEVEVDGEGEWEVREMRRRRRERRERRGWVTTERIVTLEERETMRAVLARREVIGLQVGLLADCEEWFGREIGGWLFDVWIAGAVGGSGWVGVADGSSRYGRGERVGLGWDRALVWGGDGDGNRGEMGDGSGSRGDGDWLDLLGDSEADAASDLDSDSDYGHVYVRHREDVQFPTRSVMTATTAAGDDENSGLHGFHFVPDGDDEEEGVGEGWIEWCEGGPGALDGRFVVRDILW